MPKLSPEERAQFEAFQLRESEPDEEESDFDVVIEDSKTGRRVTLPYSKSKAMLKRMGFDLDDLEAKNPADPEGGEGGEPDPDDPEGMLGGEEDLGQPATRGGRKGYWKPKA